MVSVILDTNSVIAYLNGDPDAAKRIELTPELLLPAIVIGELAYGAHKSARPEENLKPLREFSSACEIVECGELAAHEYGRIKSDLKVKRKEDSGERHVDSCLRDCGRSTSSLKRWTL